MKNYFTKGFTLVELLVTMAIVFVIMLGVARFQVNVLTNNNYTTAVISSAQDARSILTTMVKELRSARTGSNGSYAIAQAATNTLTFYSDIYATGLEDQVTYFISTTTLEKEVIIPTGTPPNYVYNQSQETFTILANNIKNGSSTPMFQYYDDTYNGTTSPLAQPVSVSAVRLVQISLLIDANPAKSPLPITYTSDATLRNLKDNL